VGSWFVVWCVVACGPAGKEDGTTPVPAPMPVPMPMPMPEPTPTTPAAPIAFVSPPTLETNPNPAVPQAFVATARTDRPCTLELVFASPEDTWAIDLLADGTEQTWPIVGVLPDTTYAVTFRALNEDGVATEVAMTATTPALPDDFPVFDVLHVEPDRMEPGYTLVSPSAPNNQGKSYIALVDAQGRVVWFYTTLRYAAEAHRNVDGNLVFLHTRREVVEVDLLGDVVETWWPTRSDFAPADAIGPDVPALHHDVHPLPNGDLLGLSIEPRIIDGFPTSDTDPLAPTTSARVAGDLIVQFDRTGAEVRRFSVLDMLDPRRIGYDVLTSSYWHYLLPGTEDWSHTNNVVHLPALDRYIFSARNQDAIVEFDGVTGEVQWILAPPVNWAPGFDDLLLEPVGADFRYPYHPHGPEWTPDDTLLLFDNGTHGASAFEAKPPEDQIRSRVVEFAIDRDAGTVSQVWSYEPGLYALALGDADHLPVTRNVLAVFGTLDDPESDHGARVVEVTRTMPPEVVFELGVRKTDQGVILEVRESDRIETLYPLGSPQPRPMP